MTCEDLAKCPSPVDVTAFGELRRSYVCGCDPDFTPPPGLSDVKLAVEIVTASISRDTQKQLVELLADVRLGDIHKLVNGFTALAREMAMVLAIETGTAVDVDPAAFMARAWEDYLRFRTSFRPKGAGTS